MSAALPPILESWFAARGWAPRTHQRAMLAAARRGDHALLVAPTGAGKTLAGFLPTLADLIDRPTDRLHTLYVSPLKALAVDVRRNLLTPIEEMALPIRVETRTGDTPSDRKARQRVKPPHILLTTPESLSLLLSYPDAALMFADLQTVIVDEVHAFATQKRGDLLSLSMARLQTINPVLRRVALSATVADVDAYRAWLAPDGDIDTVAAVLGEAGTEPNVTILIPEGRVPWSGHSGKYAANQVMAEIAAHQTTLVFCNTRGLAELIFQELWSANDANLPIAIHHGSLSIEARRKVESAMADGKLRALVATASLDLGVDWGNVDCVIQMGAPKGSSRLLQRIGRANHRLDQASEAILIPGNRFEYLEARAALDAVEAGERDADDFRVGSLDVLAQHIMGLACAGPFHEAAMLAEIQSATPYSALTPDAFASVLHFIEGGGYALRAYDRFKRLAQDADGTWRVAHPRFIQQHRLNAGIIVDQPALAVRFANGRKLGTVEEGFAAQLAPGDSFFFSGMALEVVKMDTTDLVVRATSKQARIPSWGGSRMAMSTRLADRVRAFLASPDQWHRFPSDVREWLDMQQLRSVLPQPGQLLIETFPHEGRHYLVCYSFEGWNAHQSLGMLLTRRMESQGLMPLGFVANDYALAVYGLKPVTDPHSLFSADILDHEFVDWVEQSSLLKRAFRDVAVISGLIERQHPTTMLHVTLDRVSPLAVPVLILIGREQVAQSAAEDALLIEAEALVTLAMRAD